MVKIIKNSFHNFLLTFLIFLIITGWFFSGWPQIWQNPLIPPEVEESLAASPEAFAVVTQIEKYIGKEVWDMEKYLNL